MSNIDDGGSAFPRAGFSDGDQGVLDDGDHGMSLRDWFAGQALIGLAGQDSSWSQIAKGAYIAADAMLKARGGC